MPRGLADKPLLLKWGREMLTAFNLLSQSRQMFEAGPQPVTVSDVKAFLDIAAVRLVDDRLRFLMVFKAMDSIYLNHYAECRR